MYPPAPQPPHSPNDQYSGSPAGAGYPMMAGPFHHQSYLVRRKIFQFLGAAFHIYDPSGAVAFYSKQKAFRLKEDIRVYTGEDMRTEVLLIRARNILDISATYDVFDPAVGARVGALRRKGLKSMLRDEWLLLDAADNQIGMIQEDSLAMALIRRLLANLIPQTFIGSAGGEPVFRFQQNFNPFVLKVRLDFSLDQRNLIDRRLGIAAAVLLCAIEGRQK